FWERKEHAPMNGNRAEWIERQWLPVASRRAAPTGTRAYGARSEPYRLLALGVALAAAAVALLAGCGDSDSGMSNVTTTRFVETDLVSDVSGRAARTDPNLVNPWGIALGPMSPFWVSDNGTGVSTLYDGSGRPFPTPTPLVATLPPPLDSPPGSGAAPTGVAFNSRSDFAVSAGANSGPALFIFAAEDGTISGWNPQVDFTTAVLKVDNSATGALYKGLALASNTAGNFLFATNFSNGTVDAFDKNFAPAHLSGSFSDPNIPTGFAPVG